MAIILRPLLLDTQSWQIGKLRPSLAGLDGHDEVISARNCSIPFKTRKYTRHHGRRPAVDRAEPYSAGIGEPGCDRHIR
jgi:hypothetical protein